MRSLLPVGLGLLGLSACGGGLAGDWELVERTVDGVTTEAPFVDAYRLGAFDVEVTESVLLGVDGSGHGFLRHDVEVRKDGERDPEQSGTGFFVVEGSRDDAGWTLSLDDGRSLSCELGGQLVCDGPDGLWVFEPAD